MYVTDRAERGEISARTATAHRNRLRRVVRHVGDCDCCDFGPAEVTSWQRAVGTQKPGSRKILYSTLRGFCRWMAQEGIVEVDPAARLLGRVRQPTAAPRALSGAQLARLVGVLPNPRARVVVALEARLGLRCMEVSGLDVTDWDRDTQTLFVQGKNDSQRKLPVPHDVAELLDAYVGERTSGPLIGCRPDGISKLVVGWMKLAGLKSAARDGISAHALRHTAASDLYQQTHDLKLAQKLLGHKNVQTTDRYLRPGDLDELRAALQK